MKNSLGFLDRAFLLTVVLGPAASYSIVYLFHIILALKLIRSALLVVAGRGLSVPHAIRWDVTFFCLFVGWYILSVLWAQDLAYALRYCAYAIMGSLTVFYTVRVCNTQLRLKSSFHLLAFAFSTQILLAVLEGARVIRLPFSAFSPYQVYFGRRPSDLEQFSDSAVDYILSLPTGFFGNPNNLAAFLALILPFFLLHRRWGIALTGAVAILFVIFMAGARSAMIAYAVAVLSSILFYASIWVRLAVLAFVLLIFSLGAGAIDAMKGSDILRVVEVGMIGEAVKEMVLGLAGGSADGLGSSTGARVQLMINGLEALRDTGGLGVGAGGSNTVQEMSESQPGKLTSMHNFWIEVLVDGGVGFGVLFLIWYLSVLWRLWRVGRRSSNALRRYLGRALFIGFLCFVIGAVGPSSVIYMLPMWMLVGVGLAVIWGEQRHTSVSGLR